MLEEQHLDEAALAATLARLHVPYLRTAIAAEPLALEPADLIAALARHPSPRLREALIPLFLRHPHFADTVPALAAALPDRASLTLRHMYTAAAYLQRLWRGRVSLYLGEQPLLPELFGQSEWQLPGPAEHHGEAGLRALAEHFRARTGYNWLSTYEGAMSLFLRLLALEYDAGPWLDGP